MKLNTAGLGESDSKCEKPGHFFFQGEWGIVVYLRQSPLCQHGPDNIGTAGHPKQVSPFQHPGPFFLNSLVGFFLLTRESVFAY